MHNDDTRQIADSEYAEAIAEAKLLPVYKNTFVAAYDNNYDLVDDAEAAAAAELRVAAAELRVAADRYADAAATAGGDATGVRSYGYSDGGQQVVVTL